jgi:hypothetical protein
MFLRFQKTHELSFFQELPMASLGLPCSIFWIIIVVYRRLLPNTKPTKNRPENISVNFDGSGNVAQGTHGCSNVHRNEIRREMMG